MDERGDFSDFKRSVVWKDDYINRGSYVGTNAFGATVDVDKYEWNRVEVVIQNYGAFSTEIQREKSGSRIDYTLAHESFEVSFSAKSEEARILKRSVGVLLVCKLSGPFVTDDQSFQGATFDSPSQTTSHYFYLHTKLLEIWYYD
jgi:hypothetical protein